LTPKRITILAEIPSERAAISTEFGTYAKPTSSGE
jgi:hypothetical protein